MNGPDQRHGMEGDLQFVCQVLGLSLDDVLQRANVPVTAIAGKSAGSIPLGVYFALWNACDAVYGKRDFAMRLGRAMAQIPFSTPIFAYYCSRTVGQGFQRLAVFKPLIGPLRYRLKDSPTEVSIRLEATEPSALLPQSMALFEIVFLIALVRNTTADDLCPVRIVSPVGDPLVEDFAGCRIDPGRFAELHLARQDAERRLVTRNADMWQVFEPHLRVALAEELFDSSIVERVRNTLLEALPAGHPTIPDIASRMGISPRSLQRKLADAGTSFSRVLEDMRMEIAGRYLTATSLSLQEIAFLLGYHEPSSFFRAFRKLTGTTPQAVRKSGNRLPANARRPVHAPEREI